MKVVKVVKVVKVKVVKVRELEYIEGANGVRELEALEILWRDLQTRCPTLTPFQTWEWNVAWWRQFGGKRRLHLLLFYKIKEESDTIVGIAPLMIERYLATPLRCLRWVGTGHSDYLGPIVQAGDEEAVASALLDHLATCRKGWDFADLQHLRADEPLLAPVLAPVLAPEPGETTWRYVADPCPYLILPTTWSQLTSGLSKKFRTNLGYHERLLQRSFPDTCYHLADATTLDAGLTALFTLHQRRWNARWLPGVLGNSSIQAFHREVARSFLQKGWLRLHLLSFDGEIQAALYCFALEGHTFYYLGGFALDKARYSPGTLLTAQAIKQAIAENHARFDFLRGEEPYKFRWQPEIRRNQRLLLRHHTLPGRIGCTLNAIENALIRHARTWLESKK